MQGQVPGERRRAWRRGDERRDTARGDGAAARPAELRREVGEERPLGAANGRGLGGGRHRRRGGRWGGRHRRRGGRWGGRRGGECNERHAAVLHSERHAVPTQGVCLLRTAMAHVVPGSGSGSGPGSGLGSGSGPGPGPDSGPGSGEHTCSGVRPSHLIVRSAPWLSSTVTLLGLGLGLE